MFSKKCFANVLESITNSYKEGQPLIFAALSSGSGASGVRLFSFLWVWGSRVLLGLGTNKIMCVGQALPDLHRRYEHRSSGMSACWGQGNRKHYS